MKGNNPEIVVAEILEKLGIHTNGDLKELIDKLRRNRTMDLLYKIRRIH
jgi:hypothetical protein